MLGIVGHGYLPHPLPKIRDDISMKATAKTLSAAMLAVLVALSGIAGCSTIEPQKTADARDYPGQSYYCFLHKLDVGC